MTIDNTTDTQKIELLKQISLFSGLNNDPDAFQKLAQLFTTVAYPQGHRIITEGTESADDDALYIIKSGTVEVIKKTRPGDPYKVAELSADMHVFFGEVALLDKERRSATVICRTDCEFYALSRGDFLALGDRSPAIGLAITRELTKIICQRLRKANNDIITLFDALVEEVAQSGGVTKQ
jgi:CRP-like cAMP-binding protein